jgi:hypothetical protein
MLLECFLRLEERAVVELNVGEEYLYWWGDCLLHWYHYNIKWEKLNSYRKSFTCNYNLLTALQLFNKLISYIIRFFVRVSRGLYSRAMPWFVQLWVAGKFLYLLSWLSECERIQLLWNAVVTLTCRLVVRWTAHKTVLVKGPVDLSTLGKKCLIEFRTFGLAIGLLRGGYCVKYLLKIEPLLLGSKQFDSNAFAEGREVLI